MGVAAGQGADDGAFDESLLEVDLRVHEPQHAYAGCAELGVLAPISVGIAVMGTAVGFDGEMLPEQEVDRPATCADDLLAKRDSRAEQDELQFGLPAAVR
jgi:hypothetical protein